jgi:hypothetical protein
VGKAELYNQTVHKKGNLVDRVKALQIKINRLAELPSETIIKNLQNFHSLTEDREEQFKYLQLYEQFLKTQGRNIIYCRLEGRLSYGEELPHQS